MKHHEYFNTVWTKRDREFYWDGLKTGVLISAILVPCLIVDGIVFVRHIKKEVGAFKREKGV